MDKYKCTKSFSVDEYDDNGSMIEDRQFVVEKGTVWEVSDEKYRFVGGNDSTRLEDADGRWLEVYDDTIAYHFQRI